MSTVRMNITLPEEIVKEMRNLVNPRQISKFISEATEEKIKYEKRQKAIQELKKLSPAFPEIKDSAKYIHDMRREEDEQRRKKLGKEI